MAFQFQQGDRPLPGYTIERGVGRGGFGEVYYATSDGGKEVALKYLRENPQVELRGVAHCLNLKSPYLVDLHDVKQNADGDHFVVMEYVSGPSLRDLMNAEPAGLGPEKAAYFLQELGRGLSYLHDRGIVHRDLKPGNIFYEDGYVKIGDYGLAKIMAASQHSGQTVSVGTVHYMAPEVGSGNYDRTIDIYALGVLLYEMLLGRVPFSGATMGEVLMKHLTAQPEVDQLPEPFPGVIRKALAKDPKDRYQTVNEMLNDVFSVEGLDRVSSIGAAGLTTLAAHAAAGAKVAPAKPAQAAGVALGNGSSNVGQDRPPPVINPAGAGPTRRLEQIHDRISDRVGAVVDRIDRSQIGQQVAAAGHRSAHWAERLLIALLVSAGISFGAGLLAGRGEPTYAVAVFLYVLAVVGGVILGSWLSFDRLRVEGKWLPRFIIAGHVGAGFVPVGLFSVYVLGQCCSEAWITPLLLAMILCDWPDRLRKGQRGQVCLGSAFSAGLFGFLAGMIFDGDGATVAAILAAGSLAVQSVAGIWPIAGKAKDGRSLGQHRVPDGVGVAANGLQPRPPLAGGAPAVGIDGDACREGQGPGAAVPDRMRRSGTARSLWLLASGLMALTTAMLFIASGVLDLREKDFGLLIVGGILAANCLLFTVSCALPRYANGLWRGVFRKAIFFAGTAASGACGASIGLFSPWIEDDFLGMLACVIAGGIVSLFVWFVPVPPYVPQPVSAPEPEDARRIRRGRWLIRGGKILLGVTCVLSMILLPILGGSDEDVLVMVVTPPIAVALALLVVGFVQSRRRRPERPKLEMPLRCVFDVDANPKLSQLIERHFAVLGYEINEKSDQLWCFERGNWTGQFWQSNIRQWGTKLNIAAYQLDTGGHRLTCYLDIDSAFNSPSQKQITVLESELRDLKTLLGGRDSPADSSEGLA